MPVCGKKCGTCYQLSSMECTMGKFGICSKCHEKNATYQGYTARSGLGLGPGKTIDMQPWYTLYSEYWTDFLTGWLECAISYRKGNYGHIAPERRNASQEAAQKAYEYAYGYNREVQYLPEKPAPKRFRST